eukprot:CAMPEP_0167813698 /NCGR_PEP_ID=MMETSP0112_2-20121227/1999_1 /TAXON_ID=91324 /ORGANISM="Lotharella globosa, Strain CCCM811" /LENGTH=48 /DNA_ID= /DNA_START= /DNA_END= /DNA_ORIENTATION=
MTGYVSNFEKSMRAAGNGAWKPESCSSSKLSSEASASSSSSDKDSERA